VVIVDLAARPAPELSLPGSLGHTDEGPRVLALVADDRPGILGFAADAWLSKPFELEALFRCLRELASLD
jgi:hypothetical protein